MRAAKRKQISTENVLPDEVTPDKAVDQLFLFDNVESWEKEWQGMPEFVQKDLEPFRSIVIHFSTNDEIEQFANLIGQIVTERTKYLWFTEHEIKSTKDKRYIDEP